MAKLTRSTFPGYEKWQVEAIKKQSAIDKANSYPDGTVNTHSVEDHDLKEVRKLSENIFRMHPDAAKEANKQAHNTKIMYKKVAEPETDDEYNERTKEVAEAVPKSKKEAKAKPDEAAAEA